jgi:hypothetical protein
VRECGSSGAIVGDRAQVHAGLPHELQLARRREVAQRRQAEHALEELLRNVVVPGRGQSAAARYES